MAMYVFRYCKSMKSS